MTTGPYTAREVLLVLLIVLGLAAIGGTLDHVDDAPTHTTTEAP